MKKRILSLLLILALLPALSLPVLADSYNDVLGDAWYAGAVSYVSDHGLMTGFGNGRFAPEGTVTRAQMVQILYAMEGKPEAGGSSFTDVPEGAWYGDAVNWASASGLVAGTGSGRFTPDDPVTREQLIAVLYRYADKKGSAGNSSGDLGAFPDAGSVSGYAVKPMQWAVGNVLLAGIGGKLMPQGAVTRAQMAVILKAFCEKILSAGAPDGSVTYEVETIDHNTRYPTDAIIYKPVGMEPEVGVVFYAGNPVDYRDYGTLLTAIASAGYLVISPEFPLDTAALNVIAGEEYMKQYPEIREWFLAGHSHGGGVSTVELALRPEMFKGLILIDSIIGVPVTQEGFPVLTFHATEDLAVPGYQHAILMEELAAADTTEVVIEGGNHAQFGDYGIQFNDGVAKISKEEQLEITIREILKFLKKYQ